MLPEVIADIQAALAEYPLPGLPIPGPSPEERKTEVLSRLGSYLTVGGVAGQTLERNDLVEGIKKLMKRASPSDPRRLTWYGVRVALDNKFGKHTGGTIGRWRSVLMEVVSGHPDAAERTAAALELNDIQ